LTAPSTEPRKEADGKAPAPPKPASPQPDVQLYVPPLDRPTANAALRGFQPYSSASTSPDPIKQARYTLYLQYEASENASTTSSPFGPRVLPDGRLQTIEELNRELYEYSQAARVFKPVSGMLGNRFQSSQSGSLDLPKAEPGLYQPPPKAEASKASSLADKYGDATAGNAKPPEPELTPAQQAARAGNFGPLTRTTTVFRPARLLCKRFGVRDPHEARGDEGGSAVGGKWGEATANGRDFGAGPAQPIGQSAIDEMMQSSGFRRFQAASKEVEEDAPEVAKGVFETPTAGAGSSTVEASSRAKNKPPPMLETVGYGDDESQGQEIVAEQRAPADIFAAIFADSDDDSDNDDDEQASSTIAPASTEASSAAMDVDPYAPKPAALASTAAVAEASADAVASGKVSLDDISSSAYRPSFVPATSRSSADKDKSSRSKKKSSSKRKAGALSFDLDEGAEDESAMVASRKKSKKDPGRSKDRDRDDHKKRSRDPVSATDSDEVRRRDEPPIVTGDDEWEEAAPSLHPDVLKALQQKDRDPAAPRTGSTSSSRARPKAADLY
jgi:G patch domain-containing protein 1